MDGLGLIRQRPVRTIGLTGGIGSGKSTVARVLVELGAVLVDTDAIARALTATGGAALPAIATAFGADMIAHDGALDRDRMRERVFADPSERRRLESILHPMIGDVAERQAAAAGGRTVVFDVPLLAESSRWRRRADRIVVVDCEVATQVRRVVQRSGWTDAAVRAVIAQQADRDARRALADAVVHNDGLSPDDVRLEVVRLWALWAQPAADPVEQSARPAE